MRTGLAHGVIDGEENSEGEKKGCCKGSKPRKKIETNAVYQKQDDIKNDFRVGCQIISSQAWSNYTASAA